MSRAMVCLAVAVSAWLLTGDSFAADAPVAGKPSVRKPFGIEKRDLWTTGNIHGTPEPSSIGKSQSHGCIRLTNWDAAALARMIGPQ